MTISFRLASEADLDRIDDILVKAYQFQGSRRRMLESEYLPMQPDGWWLALVDGEPVGFGGAVDYETHSWVGMLSVAPECQNQGIGELLVKQILAWGAQRGCHSMVLEANPRAMTLYQRLGFVTAEPTLRMMLEQQPANIQPPSGVAKIQPDEFAEVAAFDTHYFGGNRLTVLMAQFQQHGEYIFVTRDERGEISGYLLARPGFLGPWVASNVDDAERLLRQALSLRLKPNYSLNIPTSNEAGMTLLRRYHFRETGHSLFMWHGSPFPGQRAFIYAQASPALG